MKKRSSGSFPFWIVLVISAAWVGAVCAYALYEYSLAATPKTHLALLAGRQKVVFLGQVAEVSQQVPVLFSSDVTDEEAQSVIASKVVPELKDLTPENLPKQVTWPLDERKAQRAQELTSSAIFLGGLPPLVLLAFRAVFLWRRHSKHRRSSGQHRSSSSDASLQRPRRRHRIRPL